MGWLGSFGSDGSMTARPAVTCAEAASLYVRNAAGCLFGTQIVVAVQPAKPAVRRPPGPFDNTWFWRSVQPHRKGQPCRVTARGKMNSIEVEFPEGEKVITHRYAVRKRP